MNLRAFLGMAAAIPLLAACNQVPETSPAEPTDHAILIDDTPTFGLRSDAMWREKVARKVRAELLASDLQLGDTVRLYFIGLRSASVTSSKPLPLDRQHGRIAVANEVYRRIIAMGDDPNGGEQETNILFLLQNAGIHCAADGRGTVIIASDLVEDGPEIEDWHKLISGEAQLPAPQGRPLLNCRVRAVGAGLSAEGMPQLSSEQINSLKSGWETWFSEAGATSVFIVSGF